MDGKPSAFRAEISVEGVDESVTAFRAMATRAAHTLPLMEEISQILFEQQKTRVEGLPWTPLKQVTIDRKARTNEDTTILHDEWRPLKGGKPSRVGNQLWLALTLDGATGQIKRATRTTATFGVDSKGNHKLYYARFVQNVKGTKRRILAISDEDALAICLRIAGYIYPAPGERYGGGIVPGRATAPAGGKK